MVPRAYKASFSNRKETAVKAADGVALRGPELGLITLLLPGMILVVSCSHGTRGDRSKDTKKDRRPNESAGLGSSKEKDSRSGVLEPPPSRSTQGTQLFARLETEPGFHGAELSPGLQEPGQQSPGKWADAAK